MVACFRPVLFGLLVLALVSCEREEIRVYTVAKDPPKAKPTRTEASADESRSELSWTTPAGWTETAPGQVHAASFNIKSNAGQATVTATRLPNLAGREAVVVNMWREQVGQAPLREDELALALTEVEVAGEKGKLFEIVGSREEKPTRIITAMIHRPDASWFFKLAGDEAAVGEQKPAFLDFVKMVRFRRAAQSGETQAAPSVASPGPAKQQFGWSVPSGWEAAAPGQMQIAKFSVPPRGEAKAEVTVSAFPNDTGGTLANVNRWRRQLGLGDVDESGLAALVTPLDPSLPGALLVDLQNPPKRMLGAIVPRGERWFFYKLTGDAEAVAAERDAFIGFVKSPP